MRYVAIVVSIAGMVIFGLLVLWSWMFVGRPQ